MAGRIQARLAQLGLEQPQPSKPGADYAPFVRTGAPVFVTGQLSQWNGERRFIDKLGREITLKLIAHLKDALDGDLDRLVRCVRVAGFVDSAPEFHGQSQVINGASDLFVELFGEAGRHARMAVGVSAIPYDVAAEVE